MKNSRQEARTGLHGESVAWIATASLIAEFAERPVAVLDEAGSIRVLNGAMAQLLRCAPNVAVGQVWIRSFVLPVAAALADRAIREGLRGLVTQAEMTIISCDERRIWLSLELRRVGTASDPGLLLVVTSSRRLLDTIGDGCREMSYQISLVPAEFGLLMPPDDGRATGSLSREFCYTRRFQRSSRCPTCPAPELTAIGDSRTMVQHQSKPETEYLLIRATRLTAFKAEVVVRFVHHDELRMLIRARVDFLASSGRLTQREHDVLAALALSGDSLGEIATGLGITLGTVKFHVNNVLTKLGADSRVDLQRLLL